MHHACQNDDSSVVVPNSAPCQIMHPLVLVGLGVGVGEGFGLGVGLGLGNKVAISTRGCIIWQGCRFRHNTVSVSPTHNVMFTT